MTAFVSHNTCLLPPPPPPPPPRDYQSLAEGLSLESRRDCLRSQARRCNNLSLLQVPLHSSGNNAAFLKTGTERGDSGYSKFRYSQEKRYQYWRKIVVGHLCVLLFKYMSWCTWNNLSHSPVSCAHSAPLISLRRMSPSSSVSCR